jgi:hypothetical protein
MPEREDRKKGGKAGRHKRKEGRKGILRKEEGRAYYEHQRGKRRRK